MSSQLLELLHGLVCEESETGETGRIWEPITDNCNVEYAQMSRTKRKSLVLVTSISHGLTEYFRHAREVALSSSINGFRG